MIECLVLGDSIAVGVGQHKPECAIVAKVGINSKKWLETYGNHPTVTKPYKVVVISLGSNDYRSYLSEGLYDVRVKIKADMVVWILPSMTLKPVQRVIIKEIANEFRDKTIDTAVHQMSPDGIHPTGRGYIEISKAINNLRNR